MASEIKTVIFDVGGVLFDYQDELVRRSVQEGLGIDDDTFQKMWSHLIPWLGKGLITETELWEWAAQEYGTRLVGPEEDLLGEPLKRMSLMSEVVDLVAELKERGIRPAILSDTNPPHTRALRKTGLYDAFDPVMLSWRVGMRKPDPRIFRLMLDELGLAPPQTLFVDDREVNVAAATEELGMNTVLAQNEKQIVRDVRARLAA